MNIEGFGPMNEKLTVVGVVLAVISVAAVFVMNDGEIGKGDAGTVPLSERQETVESRAPVAVHYNDNGGTETKKSEDKGKQKVLHTGRPGLALSGSEVAYTGMDQSRRYGIQVLDPDGGSVTEKKKTFVVEGYVNGSRFIMKIPNESKYHNLSLRIVDLKTEEVKQVPLTFVAEVGENFSPQMKFDFENIDDFDVVNIAEEYGKVFP